MWIMNNPQLAAIEASLELAAARIGDPTAEVYRRLFARHPAMEAEFWRDTQGNVRGEMLARSFETILDLAGPRAWGDQLIATEVQNHAQYGVPPAIFADFLPIVADVIRDGCGEGFNSDMAAAWAAVLAEAAALAVLPA
jgi:hemoglobin-like flavoprotein